IEADVLPVEAQATQRNPPWCADDAATVMPVSLNDAVGFMPWCFAWRFSTPTARAQRDDMLFRIGNAREKFAEAPDAALVERIARGAAVEPERLQSRWVQGGWV